VEAEVSFDRAAFLNGYMIAALWSSTGPSEEPYACENLDDLFDIDDISDECRDSMFKDCNKFIDENIADLEAYCDSHRGVQARAHEDKPEAWAGHDFWLTRNGHGVGFWDRGLGELGERLSKAAKVYGGIDLYPGDDGKIYN
jgi:hypothetical protein